MPRIIQHNDKTETLPADVQEQDVTKTSVYQAGKLIYDGATGQSFGDGAASAGPGSSLNEMLKWSIENSDPAELERRAAARVGEPSRVDQEILDMILGQPNVAKMRECLGKLEPSALERPEGLEPALEALEELEYYVEDLDNANDFAKIGGVQAMLHCCSAACTEAELREAACGVLATCLQNNPKFQAAAMELGVPSTLMRLLLERDAAAEALPVQRKALYALSALLRAAPEVAMPLLDEPGLLTMLVALGSHDDTKLRRRALFLVLHLLRESSLGLASRLEPHAAAVAATLLSGAADDDLDARESALQILDAYRASSGGAAMREALVAAGAEARLSGLAETEHRAQADAIVAWLREGA